MLVAWELWKERKGKGDIALFCCYYWVDGTTPKNELGTSDYLPKQGGKHHIADAKQ
jgi:hypothetical protein